jgi:hypothetical protein
MATAVDSSDLLLAIVPTLVEVAGCCRNAAINLTVPADFRTSQQDAFYVYLRSDLRTLERSLLDLRIQGRTPPEECVEKLETISSMLDDLICDDELGKIIRTDDGQKQLQSQENAVCNINLSPRIHDRLFIAVRGTAKSDLLPTKNVLDIADVFATREPGRISSIKDTPAYKAFECILLSLQILSSRFNVIQCCFEPIIPYISRPS